MLLKPVSNNEMFSVPHFIKSSAKHCVMFSFLYLYLGLIHIGAMLGGNYRGVQH